MRNQSNIIVRFREGSGGETLTAMLHALLNDDPGSVLYDPRFNQTVFTDVFEDAFHQLKPPGAIQTRYGLPDAQWRTIPAGTIAQFVTNRFAASPAVYRVGKMHYSLSPAQTLALPPATFIDLLPRRAHAFVPAIMVLKKVYLRPAYEEPAFFPHSQFAEVQQRLRETGSFPFWWTRCLRLGLDIHDLHGFVRKVLTRSLVIEDKALYPRSTRVVPATSFLLDPSLATFRELADLYGKTLPPELSAYLDRWVARNNAMFDELGLRRLLTLSLSLEQQATLLFEALTQTDDISLTS